MQVREGSHGCRPLGVRMNHDGVLLLMLVGVQREEVLALHRLPGGVAERRVGWYRKAVPRTVLYLTKLLS